MNACERNDVLLRKMVKEGCSLSEIGRTVGTNKRHVKAYILRNKIPHKPFLTTNFGSKNGRWTGGRIIDEDGYVLLKRRDHPNCNRHGYVREHRLVMEKHLGRLLTAEEVVHHLDKVKSHNAIDNLGLYSRNGEHLADELKGQVPNWSEDGKRRLRAAVLKSVKTRQAASRERKERNGS